MTERKQLSFAQAQRLRYIETQAYWEGSIQRERVAEVFGVHPNHVTRDLQTYLERYPESLEYLPRQRSYAARAGFTPQLGGVSAEQYLALLLAHTEAGAQAAVPVLGAHTLVTAVLPTPYVAIEADVLRGVIHAMRQGKGLSVIYHSMQDDKAARRRLWPHAFASTASRWYVRAFDQQRGDFRLFALQRMSAPERVDETPPVASSTDADWEESETVQLEPNRKLNAHQQRVIAREHGMRKDGTGWIWSRDIRRCLVPFFILANRLDVVSDNALQSPVLLRDRDRWRKLWRSATD